MKLSNNMYKPIVNQRKMASGQSVNFKGMSSLFYKTSKEIADYDKLLKIASNEIGDSGSKLLKKLSKLNKVSVSNNSISFQEPTFIKKAIDNFAFPIIELPFLVVDSSLNLLKKVPGISKGAGSLYDLPILKKHRDAGQLADDVNMLKGLLETTKKAVGNKSLDEIIQKGDKNVGETLFKKANKYFDPKIGNYNTARERALNRLVTGMASAFFLADDAYNLSVLCGDKTGESQKEKKARFKQEKSRVFTTAYLQLAILGTLSKLVNNKPAATPLINAAIVLFSETTSRIKNGKPIFFLTPDKAKALNVSKNKQKNSNEQSPSNQVVNTKQDTTSLLANVAPNSISNTSFKAESADSQQKTSDKNKTKTESKTLFSFKSLLLGVGGLAIAGLGFAQLRHNPKFEKNIINKTLNNFNDFWANSLYPKLVNQDFSINVSDFEKTMSKLEEANPTIATRYRQIVKDFGVVDSSGMLKLKDIDKKNKLIKDLQKSDSSENAQKIIDLMNKEVFAQVDRKRKPFVDLVIYPFKFIGKTLSLPYRIVSPLFKIPATSIKNKQKLGKEITESQQKFVKFAEDWFGKLGKPKQSDSLQTVFSTGIEKLIKKTNDLDSGKISKEEFNKFVNDSVIKSFNGVTSSNVDNADLAKFVKMASSTVTSTFLIADNYNMVMQKSNGEDKEGAKQSAKERVVQRISSLFYQTMFIDLFNNTFSKLYHKALLGMCAVSTSSQIVMELFTRKSIGMPLGPKTYEQLAELDEKNHNKTGFAGAYFKFMSKLTGKKPLKKKIVNIEQKPQITNVNVQNLTTNLIDLALKKQS